MVLTRGTHGGTSTSAEHTADRKIVGFRPAAGENHLRRLTTDQFSDQVTGIVKCAAGVTGRFVRSRRIRMVRFDGRCPSRLRLGTHDRAGRVVEVDIGDWHNSILRNFASTGSMVARWLRSSPNPQRSAPTG